MRREPFLMLVLLAGCARSSADLLDASLGPITGVDGGVTDDDSVADSNDGDGSDDDGEDVDGAEGDGSDSAPDDDAMDADAADSDSSDSDGTDVGPDDADATDDGPLDGDDMSAEDAGPEPTDSGTTPEPIVADFVVQQRNAALQAPVATNLQLAVGDRLRIQGSGNIWPGLVLQGCCGPAGTTGTHSGAEWPLQGGPDFALVAFVNGAWEYVGPDTTFDITVAGALQLGTNDNDPGTGNDCNSVPPDERGFRAHVVLTPAP